MLFSMLDNNRKCSVCDCVYPNPRALIRHFRTHVQSNKKNNIRLECDYCDTVFTNRDSISRHLKTQHGMTRNGDIIAVPPISCEQLDDGSLNECEFCSKIFKNGDALRLHMIRQHKSNSLDTPRSPIPDEETQPVLNTSRSTPLYPAVNTSSYENCTCHCGKTFLRLLDYRQHINQYHKIDLDLFEHECPNQQAFEQFKLKYSRKYCFSLVEEAHLDGSKWLVFKCDKNDDLNGTCTAKLNVFEKGNGFMISGIVTHINHEVQPHVFEQILPITSQATPKEVNKQPTIQQLEPVQKVNDKKLTLDLFNVVKEDTSLAKNDSNENGVSVKKPRLDLAELGFKKNGKQKTENASPASNGKQKSSKMSLSLFSL